MKPRVYKTTLAALATVVLALGSLLMILLAGNAVQLELVHSDAMYLPVLFDDLLRAGGSLRDWYLTPAPYFFPDFPLFLLAWIGGHSAFEQTTIFAMLQTALMSFTLFLLAREALDDFRVLATAALVTLFIWLGLHVGDPFLRLFSSAHHYGAFVAALLLAALWFRLEAAPPSQPARRTAIALAGLVYLTTLSDALFLVQAVAPLSAAALLCGVRTRPGEALKRLARLLWAPAILGMVSYRFVVAHPTRYKTRLGLSHLSANLDEFGRICAALFGQRPLLAALLLLSLLAGLAFMLACLRRKAPAFLPRPLELLLMFATLSCAATVTVMLLSTSVQPAPRYLIAALCWPLVGGMFALVHVLGGYFRYLGLAVAFAFCALLASDAWRLRDYRETDSIYYPEQIACIDRALASSGARHGIAQYWDAKRIQGLSHQHLTMAQYTGTLAPMKWITSERFFSTRYDFAIIADKETPEFRLPREQLTATKGEPAETITCGDRSVLLFGQGRLRMPPPVDAMR